MKIKHMLGAALSVPLGRWVFTVVLLAIVVGLVLYFIGNEDRDLRLHISLACGVIVWGTGAYVVFSGKAFDSGR